MIPLEFLVQPSEVTVSFFLNSLLYMHKKGYLQ